MSWLTNEDIIEEFSITLCMVMFSLRMFLSVTRIAQYLDLSNPPAPIIGWIFEVFITVIMTVLIILSFYYNYKYRNHLFKVHKLNHKLLFLIFIPTGIFAVMYKTVSGIAYIDIGSRVADNLANLLLTQCLFMVMVVYISDINMNRDDGEVWRINFTNILAIIVTIIFMVGDSTMILFHEQKNSYMAQVLYSNKTKLNHDLPPLIVMTNFLNPYFYKIGFICEFFAVLLLIEPMNWHLELLDRSKERTRKIDHSRHVITNISIVTVAVSYTSFTCVTVLSLSRFFVSLNCYGLRISVIVVHIVSIVNIFFILLDNIKNPRRKPKNIFYYFFLLFGFFGQSIYLMSAIQHSFYLTFADSFLRISQLIAQMLQIFNQNILIAVLMEREKESIDHNAVFSFIYDPRILIAVNFGHLVGDLCVIMADLEALEYDRLWLKLSEKYLMKMGSSISIFNKVVSISVLTNYCNT